MDNNINRAEKSDIGQRAQDRRDIDLFRFTDLTVVGIKHNTDKAFFHLFTEFYQNYFSPMANKDITIFEIGIASGASLGMLREFFPRAEIYAIDIDKNSTEIKHDMHTHLFLCDQTDTKNLDNILTGLSFDIIIDDGSHITSHQQKSLGYLFPYLAPGGIYICEDLHTSLNKKFVDTTISMLALLEEYCVMGELSYISNKNLTIEEIAYLNENIENVDIYNRDRNAPFCYACKKANKDDFPKCIYCKAILDPFMNKSITSVIKKKDIAQRPLEQGDMMCGLIGGGGRGGSSTTRCPKGCASIFCSCCSQ